MQPKVKVLYAPGINCHYETAEAFRMVGADPDFCNLTSDLLTGKQKLTECDLIVIPGGFSFGDHVAAGRIFAIDLIFRLNEQLMEVREKHIPIIGICNGFQILINSGLLPGNNDIGKPVAIVDRNRSAVFESRWVDIYVQDTDCVWTQGIDKQKLRIPVAHGEGRISLPDDFNESRTVFRYGSDSGTEEYPENPNGSVKGRAGICDPTGTILGMMPHPERAVYPWLGSEDGLEILKAGVKAVK
ncbi:MAG: phosphoribosylformylglycinamidine synthase I [bacterium]